MTDQPLKICFVISEAEPLIKVGGLGDVGGTLPAALAALPKEKTDGRGIDVRVVIPYHDILKEKGFQFLSTDYDVSRRLLIYENYYVEVVWPCTPSSLRL